MLLSASLLDAVAGQAVPPPKIVEDPNALRLSAFEVHARFGDNNPNAGDWEFGLTSNTNQPPQDQENFGWTNGSPVSFSFTLND